MAKKKKNTSEKRDTQPVSIRNKKARFDYEILEKLEAGMVLTGTEVKSLRQGRASLEEAYARVIGEELFLVGCTIQEYAHGNIHNHAPTRTRKLLVHRREIKKLLGRMTQKGLTLVPVRIYFIRGLAKVEIALARGKAQVDKRDAIKRRQMDRDADREVRRMGR